MPSTARNQVFDAVQTIGGLLPADMLVRISEGKDVSGSKPADYHIAGSRSVRDEAERHWDYLKSLWTDLRTELPGAPESDTPADPSGMAVSQWLLPLFNVFGFGSLTRLGTVGLTSDDGTKAFAITHRWNHVPIHMAAWNVSLDKRPDGAGSVPAQSLVQELLNRTDAHPWGVVTNGRQLRLLRDSSALATASYVEFDLEAIFDGELFSEFVLLYRLLQVTRFEVAQDTPPSTCWLEKWRLDAIASGTRALDSLRDGVQNAITTLGTGFLKHPANSALRENIDVGALHNALLRLVYRLLFVFVAEDREVLHSPDADDLTRDRYARYFSTARLRAHARRRKGTAHDDLYRSVRIVLDALGNEDGRPELGLPGLGGIFDDTPADAPLHGLSLSNESLLTAIRHLAQVRDASSRRWRSVDYRHLDAEELGSIYESLLELVPRHSAVDREFELVAIAGNARKTTGSYYTPSSLIACLLDTTLDPVIDDAVKRGEQAATALGHSDPSESIVDELLSLTVCDPACGSGHFLVAAARRIAKRVAAVREHNPEPTLAAVQHALHEVIARCIYGVDLNPMAVELAKVSLWLEALEPGKPLDFLDVHIKCGNALIGATPALLRAGIPDEAFKPIEGDDKKLAKALEKQNKSERLGQSSLFDLDTEAKVSNTAFASGLRQIINASSNTLADVRRQASAYWSLAESAEYVHARHIADAWCAAFLWPKTADAPFAITEGVFQALQDPDTDAAPQRTHNEVVRLAKEYRFFHWHLEFPEVFSVMEETVQERGASGWDGGFSCVLGNPPWERVKLQEQEFFAQRDEKIATARNAAARKDLIATLKNDSERSWLYAEFEAAKRRAEGESHLLRIGGRYPLTGRGDINTYAVFAETDRALTGSRGRMGVIVPSGIATDATTQYFFKDLVASRSLTSVIGLVTNPNLWSGIGHNRYRLSLLSVSGKEVIESTTRYATDLLSVADLDVPENSYELSRDEIALVNPNTGTAPAFRTRRDAEITLEIYRHIPVLIKDPDEHGHGGSNPWGVSFMRMFDMSNDSHLFRGREELEGDGWTLLGNIFKRGAERMLPLYEAKMTDFFNHRAADVVRNENAVARQNQPRAISLAELQDPERYALPLNWVSESDSTSGKFDTRGRQTVERGIASRLADKGWHHNWLLGWRDVTAPTNERTSIPVAFPLSGVGNKLPLMLPSMTTVAIAGLIACQSSFVFDYVSRQKIGGVTMNMFIWRQLPTISPDEIAKQKEWISKRILELIYTAHDMALFARDFEDFAAPFRWNEDRRDVIRAELDALFFHLYGISRADTDYVLDTFAIVKRKDEAKYGTYRTKDLILAEYDRMAEAGVSFDNPLVDGENYTSTLNPPPGHGPRHPAAAVSGEEV